MKLISYSRIGFNSIVAGCISLICGFAALGTISSCGRALRHDMYISPEAISYAKYAGNIFGLSWIFFNLLGIVLSLLGIFLSKAEHKEASKMGLFLNILSFSLTFIVP